MTALEKVTVKLDEIASRASNRRRDVGQLIDALGLRYRRLPCSGLRGLGVTPKQRLKVCDDAIERIAQELGA